MGLQKKYRGAMERVLASYVQDRLAGRKDIDSSRVFITHSGSPGSDIDLVRGEIQKYANFKEIYVTSASCTIAAHCGPRTTRTLNVLYMAK